MSACPTTPSLRADLAARVAALNDLVLFADLDDRDITRLIAEIDGLLPGRDDRSPWWHDEIPHASYRRRSPFSGVENPRSPMMTIERLEPNAPTMIGRATLDKGFAGPPSAVHGGVLAGMFDELCGAVAGAAAPGRVVVTAKLTLRYRRPTPLRTPFEMVARVSRQTQRRIVITASCECDGLRTADAEALMVAS